MGRIEVLEHRQAFLEVRDDRRFDDLARGLGHQAPHAGQLLHLGSRTAGPGMGHHIDRVHFGLLAGFFVHLVGRNPAHHFVGHLVGALGPGVNNLVVFFTLGDQALLILVFIFLDQKLGLLDQLFLGRRNDHVVLAERNSGPTGLLEAQTHDMVAEQHRLLLAAMAIHLIDDLGDFFLGQHPVDQIERQLGMLGKLFRNQHPPRRRLDPDADRVAVFVDRVVTGRDFGMHADDLVVEGHLYLVDVCKGHAFAGLARAVHGDIIEPQDDVLARHDDRLAVGRAQNIICRHHQDPRLELCLQRQRHMHSHLVAVEVGVKSGAHQRMKLNRLAFDEHRFESLNAKSVQGRSAIEQHRVFANHFVENIPDLAALAFHQLLGLLDRSGNPFLVEQ